MRYSLCDSLIDFTTGLKTSGSNHQKKPTWTETYLQNIWLSETILRVKRIAMKDLIKIRHAQVIINVYEIDRDSAKMILMRLEMHSSGKEFPIIAKCNDLAYKEGATYSHNPLTSIR
ncbi:hypothetical protein L2E82_05153 [Cichorium intybus]|uniref:Uncharacterized protein n=1 Tax=Cichorium intybus TaxID=13427 RepID=A0ACB9H6M4_CICIN|nr:hypothetical protein L2E82_05153 [Cichorium intybus]